MAERARERERERERDRDRERERERERRVIERVITTKPLETPVSQSKTKVNPLDLVLLCMYIYFKKHRIPLDAYKG